MIWVQRVTRIYWPSTWKNSASRHFMTFRHEQGTSRSLRSPCHRLGSGYCGDYPDYPGSLWWDFLDLPAVMLCQLCLTALCVFKSHLDLISKVIPVKTYCKNLPASETINSFSGSLVIVTSAKFRVKFKRRQHVWKENQTMFISKKISL